MNIAEVAKLAGVSPAAVSRYLNQGYLSQEKKDAIRKVIEETGYRPMAQAQALRTRKTKTIGTVLTAKHIAALKKSRVPEDIRVSGQGGADLCEVTIPTITTIRYYYEESGANAASLLLDQLENPNAPAKEIKLGYAIVENESS